MYILHIFYCMQRYNIELQIHNARSILESNKSAYTQEEEMVHLQIEQIQTHALHIKLHKIMGLHENHIPGILLVHDLYMTCVWLVHDLYMTCT